MTKIFELAFLAFIALLAAGCSGFQAELSTDLQAASDQSVSRDLTIDRTTVKLLSPLNDTKIEIGQTLQLLAEANHPSGVYRVDFYVNGALTCIDEERPWDCKHTFKTQGEFKIYAVGYNNRNGIDSLEGYSDSVAVRVIPLVSEPPKTIVRIVRPGVETRATVGQTVDFIAEASHPAGIYRVDFYLNGQLIPECVNYDQSWDCKQAFKAEGKYTVFAIAYNNASAAGETQPTRSEAVVVEVNEPVSTPPTMACTISLEVCPNYPAYRGTFIDPFLDANKDAQRCLDRAEDYYRWCSNSTAAPINPVRVEFSVDGKGIASRAYPERNSACWVKLPERCPNHPEVTASSFIDVVMAANLDVNACVNRAADYATYCGATATTEFYANSILQKSVTVEVPRQAFACEDIYFDIDVYAESVSYEKVITSDFVSIKGTLRANNVVNPRNLPNTIQTFQIFSDLKLYSFSTDHLRLLDLAARGVTKYNLKFCGSSQRDFIAVRSNFTLTY